MDDLTHQPLCEIYAEEWDNLGQQCLDELVDSMPRGHASMQEDMLLGIRGTGVYCNLDYNFWKSICMMEHHALCGFHEHQKELKCCLCGSLFHLYVKVLELVEPRWCKTLLNVCGNHFIYILTESTNVEEIYIWVSIIMPRRSSDSIFQWKGFLCFYWIKV